MPVLLVTKRLDLTGIERVAVDLVVGLSAPGVDRLATRGRRLVSSSHTPWSSLRIPAHIAWRASDGLDAATIAVFAAAAASLPSRTRGRRS